MNTTYYSSTNAPTYTATSANGVQTSSSTGTLTPGTPTVLSTNGPTAGTTVSTPSTSGGASSTLADVAQYYYATDLRTSALSNCTGSADVDGNTHDVCSNTTMLPMPPLDVVTHQHMTTFTVGLGVNGTLTYDPNYLNQTSGAYVDLTNGTTKWPAPTQSTNGGDARNIDDLWHAAVNGRGRYFATSNPNTLSNALQTALMEVAKAIGSAAGASTNSLEPVLGGDNRAYIATYTTVEWSGDVKAYPLDAVTGNIDMSTTMWSARTQLESLSAASRKIKYMNPTTKALTNFTYSNLNGDGYGTNFTNLCTKSPTPVQCGTLTPAQVTSANDGNNLVNFLRGDATYEAETNLVDPLYRERAVKLGDVVNASPVYVKKSTLKYNDAGYTTFVTSTASRRGMLYVAANDGMLHAFDAATGAENWAFVPSFVMPNLYRLADTNYRNQHRYLRRRLAGGRRHLHRQRVEDHPGRRAELGRQGLLRARHHRPRRPGRSVGVHRHQHGVHLRQPRHHQAGQRHLGGGRRSGLNNADGVGRLFLVNAATGALVTHPLDGRRLGGRPQRPGEDQRLGGRRHQQHGQARLRWRHARQPVALRRQFAAAVRRGESPSWRPSSTAARRRSRSPPSRAHRGERPAAAPRCR